MSISAEVFIHESDRAALAALKAIPGFDALMKAFMKVWSEKTYKILNMSTNLRVSPDQLPQYYEMLLPVCARMGIDVPEIYIELNPVPNAYTYGDTEPFIVLTSGLIEALPEELIQTVIAHECGHIVCHHTLYRTVGRFILAGLSAGLGALASLPLQMAFSYWMRCSEYSADRVAAVFNGDPEKMKDVCMRLAGFDKDLPGEANMEAFLAQAKEYKEYVDGSAWNKTMEFMVVSRMDHPLTALRALYCDEWSKTDSFANTVRYLDEEAAGAPHQALPVTKPLAAYTGRDYREVAGELYAEGFTNILLSRETERRGLARSQAVTEIWYGEQKKIELGDWIPAGAPVYVCYFEEETEEELRSRHPGQARARHSAAYYVGRKLDEAEADFTRSGFVHITAMPVADIRPGLLARARDLTIESVTIGGQGRFKQDEWFDENAEVVIVYHTIG